MVGHEPDARVLDEVHFAARQDGDADSLFHPHEQRAEILGHPHGPANVTDPSNILGF